MKTLRTQLSACFALVVLISVALVSLVSNLCISRQFEQYVVQQQKSTADDLAGGLVFPYDLASGSWNEEYIHGLGMYALNDGYMLKLFDADGEVVWDAENHDMTLCHQIMEGISLRLESSRAEGGGDLVTQSYELHRDGAVIGRAEIRYYAPYYTNENAFRFLDSLNSILVGVGLFSLLGAAAAGLLLARHISVPIARATQITGRIAQGDYAVRVTAPSRTREVRELTESVNHMAEVLQRQEMLRRQLSTDVAHELRTPLSNVSAHLEMMREGVWEPSPERLDRCYEEIGRISRLVSDLERLHDAERCEESLTLGEVDLYALSQAAARDFEADFAARGLTCEVSGERCVVPGDERRLRQVLVNLLSNAVKYTGEGGHICIRVEGSAESALLRVEDDGNGIPEEEQALVFERFYRTDRSRSRKTGGVGIGLSIVKAIVQAHGGTVCARSREGGGSCFLVSLPRKR